MNTSPVTRLRSPRAAAGALLFGWPLWWAPAAALVAGLAKEAIDALGFGTVEASDVAWTAAGGVPMAIAVGVMW